MDSRGSINYGSMTLFQTATFDAVNAKKKNLRGAINARRRCLNFSYFMTGKYLAISVGLFCFTAFFATAIPAGISLLAMKFFQPDTITYDNMTFTRDSEDRAVIRRRDINLLWAALACSIAAVIGMFLYCIAGGVNERIRYQKINMEQLLTMLRKVPELQSDATVEAISAAMDLLTEVEGQLDIYLHPDIESESMALVRQGMRA